MRCVVSAASLPRVVRASNLADIRQVTWIAAGGGVIAAPKDEKRHRPHRADRWRPRLSPRDDRRRVVGAAAFPA
jgi:hypothetical protein